MTRVLVCGLAMMLAALPGRADTELARGVAHFESGRIAEAQSVFQAMVSSQPDSAQAAYYLGRTFQEQGEMKSAMQWFERAVELDDQRSAYFQRLGEAAGTLAGEVGMFKAMRLSGKIKGSFERAVALDADNVDARSGLITFYLNAPGVAGGSVDKALEQAEAIASRDALRGHFARARVYEEQEEPERAEREYRAAIKLGADTHDPYLALGVHLTSQERFAEAMAIYDQWLDGHPDDLSVSYQVGRTASIAADYLEQGQRAFEQYLASTPTSDMPPHAWAQYRLGLIHLHRGNEPAARKSFERALELDPKHKQAKRALKKL